MKQYFSFIGAILLYLLLRWSYFLHFKS